MKKLFVRCVSAASALVFGAVLMFGGMMSCRTADEPAELDGKQNEKSKAKQPSSNVSQQSGTPNGKQPAPETGQKSDKKPATPNGGTETGEKPAEGGSGTGQNGSAEKKTPVPNGGDQPAKAQTLTPSAVAEDARTVKLVFRREVSAIVEMKITPDAAVAGLPQIAGAGGKWTAIYTFTADLKSGAPYSITGTAKNKTGKLMPFSAQFTGFNNALPELEITEIHAVYDSKKRDRKFEYVELHAKRGGNLSGLEIRGLYDKCRVKLPSVSVKTGEMLVMHLRNGGEGCINELGDDLSQSTAPYSSANARDLWDKNTRAARLGDVADIIVLHNTADDSVMDAVVYAPAGTPDWEAAIAKNALSPKPEAVKRAASAFKTMQAALVKEKKWPDAAIQSAANSEGLAASRTLEKVAAGTGGSAWKLSGDDGASPGKRAF